MILAVLRERLPWTPWSALLVQPETVLGWHRDLVRRRWAAYRRRPRQGRPSLEEKCRELIVRMAQDNPNWGYFRIRGELLKLRQTVSATAIRSVLIRGDPVSIGVSGTINRSIRFGGLLSRYHLGMRAA